MVGLGSGREMSKKNSKKVEHYRQCRLRKKIAEETYSTDTAWIPERFAKVNKYIKIKKDPGVWQVVKVFGRKKAEDIEAQEMDYKKQRKVSDV